MIKSYFIYGDNKPFSGGGISRELLDSLDANKKYAEHFSNIMYLKFVQNHSDTSYIEKEQAGKEIIIAERKMKFWKNQRNWDIRECGKLTSKIKKDWQ